MKKKLKIHVIGPTYPYRGGIPHYNTLLCDNLAKKHHVTCISFKRLYPNLLFPGRDQRDRKSKNKIKTKALEMLDSINPFTWFKVVKKIKKDKPDLLLMYWWTPFFFPSFSLISWLVKKLTKTKILFLCHNVLPHDKSFLDKFLSKNVLKNADYFIVHSKQDKKDLIGMIPNAKVAHGVHPIYEMFKQKPMPKGDAQAILNLNGKVITFFGFIRKYKGLEYLIKALPDVLKEQKVTLLIVGEFWELKEETLELIKNLGLEENIKIYDEYIPNEEVGKYICASDVIVLPYNHATNSGIIQTAFGFEKPVIVTDVGGLPEVVLNNKTGFVVPTKDSEALASAINRFYKENKEKNFIEGIKKDKARFEWKRMVERIEAFFK